MAGVKGKSGRYKKGESGNPKGRPKGIPNKFPAAIKDKVLHACAHLESIGKDLATVAAEKPEWFYETFLKPMLPKEVWIQGGDNPLRLILEKQKPDA